MFGSYSQFSRAVYLILLFFFCQLIIAPVLNSFSDQDSRVRYYACEALYNIAKVGSDELDSVTYVPSYSFNNVFPKSPNIL